MATRSQIVSPSSSSSPNFSSKLESLTLKETNNNFAPWLDLPVHLTEEFLERLTISDYVRFGAVCPQWRCIQQNHRRRHARSPPPLLNLPWIVPCQPQHQPQHQQEPVDCFSPFEQRSHRIRLPLPRRYLEGGIENSGLGLGPRSWHSYEPNGWLVLDNRAPIEGFYFTLLNPLSGVQIELPRVGYDNYGIGQYILSVSPPPGCFVFLMAGWHFFVFREWDGFWTDLDLSAYNMICNSSPEESYSIFWEGKFYHMSGRGLLVIDHLPSDPTVEILEMDQSQLPTLRYRWEDDVLHNVEVFMVESNGKLFLIVEFCEGIDEYSPNPYNVVVGFQVFEADFSNKRWVRLESLGDRVLFIHKRSICSLFADDIGAEGNCIYFTNPYKIEERIHQNSSRVGPIPWNVFNLDTGKLTESSLLYAPTSDTLMFVPRLS